MDEVELEKSTEDLSLALYFKTMGLLVVKLSRFKEAFCWAISAKIQNLAHEKVHHSPTDDRIVKVKVSSRSIQSVLRPSQASIKSDDIDFFRSDFKGAIWSTTSVQSTRKQYKRAGIFQNQIS